MENLNLAKRAMLTSITIELGGLLGERRDKIASELVENTYSVASKRAKASKFLIDRKHPKVKGVVAAAQQVRAIVYRLTFPWGDSGLRLLPAKAFTEFNTKVRAALANLEATQQDYLLFYPSLVQQSEQDLGGMFDATQYPSVDKIAGLFRASVSYWPMPEAGHFVADIASDVADEARASITADNLSRTNAAVNDMVARTEQTVQMFVDKLQAYRKTYAPGAKTPEIENIFRDSLIDNVAEMAALIKTLNFTEDPGIDTLALQVERLARFTAEHLRDDAAVRGTMVSEGQALLAKLDAFRKTDDDIADIVSAASEYASF